MRSRKGFVRFCKYFFFFFRGSLAICVDVITIFCSNVRFSIDIFPYPVPDCSQDSFFLYFAVYRSLCLYMTSSKGTRNDSLQGLRMSQTWLWSIHCISATKCNLVKTKAILAGRSNYNPIQVCDNHNKFKPSLQTEVLSSVFLSWLTSTRSRQVYECCGDM